MDNQYTQLQGHLARNVRRLRKQAGLSQGDLASQADVDRTYVSQIERALGNPSLLIVCKLARVLQVSFLDLFSEAV